MTFILISGKTGVGKTNVCNKLHDLIAADATFTVHDKKDINLPWSRNDFIAHYEKCGKHIVLNSPSDKDDCMLELADYIDGLAKNEVLPDIVITTIRETNVQNDQMSRMLALLDAFTNNEPSLVAQYKSSIMTKPIHTLFAPAALGCNVFVLHLEKKQMNVNVSEEEQEKALARYWDDNADNVKYLLDFALARL